MRTTLDLDDDVVAAARELAAIGVEAAREVLAGLRAAGAHRFVVDEVSMTDVDVPPLTGHRQVTDAHLFTLARRAGMRVVTFDAGLSRLAGGQDVELLRALQPPRARRVLSRLVVRCQPVAGPPRSRVSSPA